MQQPNLICIDNKIINLDTVTEIVSGEDKQLGFWIRFDFMYSEINEDGTGSQTPYSRFYREKAQAAYDYLKSQCIAVFDDSTEVPPQSEDFIDPNWTKQHVIGIEHKLSGSGNPTWYCSLDIGTTLYIRQSNKDIWLEHYPQLEDMDIGDFISIKDVDITCYTMPDENSDFLRTMKVLPGGKLKLPELSASAQRKAQVATALKDYQQWAWLDLETTGMNADDEIMQIGLIHPSGEQGQILNQRDILVKPMDAQKVYRVGKNNKSAYNIHGISPAQVEDAKPFPEHYDILREAIHGKPLATYSEFDLKMLNQVAAMHNLDRIAPSQHIDLIKLFAKFIGQHGFKPGDYKWQSLEDAYKLIIGTELQGAHAAITDAQAMREIVIHIVEFSSVNEPF